MQWNEALEMPSGQVYFGVEFDPKPSINHEMSRLGTMPSNATPFCAWPSHAGTMKLSFGTELDS